MANDDVPPVAPNESSICWDFYFALAPEFCLRDAPMQTRRSFVWDMKWMERSWCCQFLSAKEEWEKAPIATDCRNKDLDEKDLFVVESDQSRGATFKLKATIAT